MQFCFQSKIGLQYKKLYIVITGHPITLSRNILILLRSTNVCPELHTTASLGEEHNLRVYHFLNSEFGLKDLKEKRLKISQIMSLNDPFEFLSVELSDPIFRKAMKKTKEQLAKTNGLICFSANWKNPVQWAHYADNHQGLCLGFDIPDNRLTPVDYVDERLSFTNPINEYDMLRIFSTKFKHWEYEEEHRVFTELTSEENGVYYFDLSTQIMLKQVIIGATSKVTKKQVVEAYESDIIDVFKARPAFKSFEIVRNRAYD